MKYFLHDTSAFEDEKISELFMNFGYEGLGLFYTILEKLAKQEKPIKTSVLKHQLKVGKRLEKCWYFMESLGIISSNNSETFNKQLLNFSEKYQIKKEKNAKKISEWREKQQDTKNVTGYEPVCNHPKVKESKVNVYKEKSKKEMLSKIQEEFYDHLKSFVGEFSKETLREFYDYWSEPNKSETKIKWQLEKTWDTKKRLERWERNKSKFKQNGKTFNHHDKLASNRQAAAELDAEIAEKSRKFVEENQRASAAFTDIKP